MSDKPTNCFDYAVRYLQGKSVRRVYHSLSEIRAGDLLTFSCGDRFCIVVAIDERRGHTFQNGKEAVLRIKDLSREGTFLGGASLG